ncbi:MAG: hypothetical protein HYV26_10110 [Candidatus Hydrogenedentes bacterium]|nr:hypothetical protein [Candidatus Hydrogenedentota bacterium]
MHWEQLLLSGPAGVALLLALAGLALVVAGLGFRRAGKALTITFGVAAGVAIAMWWPAALISLKFSGRGEGAGVAAIIMAFVVSGGTALLVLMAGAAWIMVRRQRFFTRAAKSFRLLGAGVFLMGAAGAIVLPRLLHVTPGIQSSQVLAEQALGGHNGPLRAEAREILLARGQEAAPAVIEALRKADPATLREFESGLNLPVLSQLEVLGQLGGPEAIQELRTWFSGDFAPDIRATAAQALGAAGDRESAHVIALHLEDRSYEWRKYCGQLLCALRLLKATNELPQVCAALQFTPEEEGSSFQIMTLDAGIQTLLAFDTPEAWQVIVALAGGGSEERRRRIEDSLEALGRSLSTLETQIKSNQSGTDHVLEAGK